MKKVILTIVFILLIPVAFVAYLVAWNEYSTYPPEVINYHSSSFVIGDTQPVFYSLGNELKYGNKFSNSDPTIYKSEHRFSYVYVSPNNQLAALVTNNKLVLASNDGEITQVVATIGSSMSVKKQPLGTKFYRSSSLQWSQDSKSFYLIEDVVYERGDNKYKTSKPNTLFKYNLHDSKFIEVIRDMPWFTYFLGESGIYFVAPKGDGDLLLKHKSNNGDVNFVDMNNLKQIRNRDKIFYNYTVHDYSRSLLNSGKVRTEISSDRESQIFYINGSKAIETKKGTGFKGPYYGASTGGSVGIRNSFTPDGTYFILNVSSKQFKGQLIFDTKSLKYTELPSNFRLYQNINTHSSSDWKITSSGIEAIK